MGKRNGQRTAAALQRPRSAPRAAPPPSPAQGTSTGLPQPQTNAKGQILCPLVNQWRHPTGEELVRQSYILHLHCHYGYGFDQMDQERRIQHGHNSPRADIVVWESAAAKNARQSPKIVVECKAERVPIHTRDYYQGESYGRATASELLVMHNERQTHVFKLILNLPGELVQINELPRAADWGDTKRIEAIKNSTRTFNREEFRKLLFDCHCILRDVHKLNPIDAFDEISKVLFIKMYVERRGTWGTFTTDYINQREQTRLPGDPPVHRALFSLTRDFYKDDQLFARDEQLRISEETFKRLVKELERFNLSATDDDVKGIAFERFLGDTFRGEMGQFFTPRTVVDFMVKMLNPTEKELVCDPAAGSGGFLIATYEHIRQQIEADVQARKDAARQVIEAKKLPEEKEHDQINAAFADLRRCFRTSNGHRS